jgi:hypothetical protein
MRPSPTTSAGSRFGRRAFRSPSLYKGLTGRGLIAGGAPLGLYPIVTFEKWLLNMIGNLVQSY